MSIIAELQRRKVFRVATAYLVFAWVIIQVVETVFPAFGFDDAAFRLLVIALAIGLVPTLILAWAYELTRHGLVPERRRATTQDPGEADPTDATPLSFTAVLRQPRLSIPLAAALLLAGGAIVSLSLELRESRVVREELLPRIEALAEAGDIERAYALALEAERGLPGDPQLERLWPQIAVHLDIDTDPAGAQVAYRRYAGGEDWVTLGTTPLTAVRLPRSVLHWRFELGGHETAERVSDPFDGSLRVELTPGTLPPESIRIPSGPRGFLLTGFILDSYDVPTFLADRTEVSNEAYLEFVHDGGYERPAFWEGLTFHDGDRALDWSEAMDRFRDRSGRQGPATWEAGTFPAGQARFPVAGISWFEAMAYARYRGKQLPTIFHWSAMSLFPTRREFQLTPNSRPGFGMFRSEFADLSNFSGTGPAPVGAHAGLSPFGVADVAGNVREWCRNAVSEVPDSQRYILGGAWNDPTYLHTYGITRSPWNRSPENGIRLIDVDDVASPDASLNAPIPLPEQERLAPISDEVFAVYRDLYDYDPKPLDPETVVVDDEPRHWRRETVSIDTAYGDERMLVHLFLPRGIEPPYQTVAYFPSSDAIFRRSSDDLELGFVDFIIKSGRALAYPVLEHTYERYTGRETTWPHDTREYSESVVHWIQDFRRMVDYLETRPDLDITRLGFYGFSWGGWNGPIVLALDPRFVTGVFLSGGIPPTLARPEASSASFSARVTQPVLMISGRSDVVRPVATYQAPMFESLGTSDALKRHAILEGGHLPDEMLTARETLAWFDRFLGPVE